MRVVFTPSTIKLAPHPQVMKGILKSRGVEAGLAETGNVLLEKLKP
jgi:hypothetical protein